MTSLLVAAGVVAVVFALAAWIRWYDRRHPVIRGR